MQLTLAYFSPVHGHVVFEDYTWCIMRDGAFVLKEGDVIDVRW
jgi:hypothetical protein